MKKKTLHSMVLYIAGGFMLFPSCVEVNDDYDLSGDIDMTIAAGGDLTLPTSGTVKMKMKDVLDLDEDGIVKTVGADSVYYLIKNADSPSTFEFDLPNITVNDPTLDPFKLTFSVPTLESLLSSFGLSEAIAGQVIANKNNVELLKTLLGDDATVVRESPAIELNKGFNVLDYDFTIPKEVECLKEIGFSVPMQPDFDLTTDMPAGELGLHDVNAEFPALLNHDNITFGGTWLGHLNENGRHQYNLPKNVWMKRGEHTRLELEFVGIDMTANPWERAAHPNGMLTIAEEVGMHGTVTVRGSILDFLSLAGETFTLTATIQMKAPEIGDVTVVVNPNINPESTTIELNDLPDFLTENDVTVVLQQPAIHLNIEAKEKTFSSPLPVQVECWGELNTDKGIRVELGNEAEPAITIGYPTVKSDWYIWDGEQKSSYEGYSYYQAKGLTNIIEEIPNQIDLNFDARVKPEYVTLALGTSYKAVIDYKVECPLALAAGSQIVYTETVDDLHKDLEDFEVKALKITAKLLVESPRGGTVPFDKLDLDVKALDLNGNPIKGIVVTPLENVSSGETIELNLTCEEGAMKVLDALTFEVAAKVTENNAAPLSAKTTIQLTDVSVGIIGGVVADLN